MSGQRMTRTRLERDVLWEGSIGSFGIDHVELPGGRATRLALLHHPGASAVVPFLDEARILLLWQYRYAAGGYLWEVPAGKLGPDEDPALCAARELAEEPGRSSPLRDSPTSASTCSAPGSSSRALPPTSPTR